jgi:hypothetical protein
MTRQPKRLVSSLSKSDLADRGWQAASTGRGWSMEAKVRVTVRSAKPRRSGSGVSSVPCKFLRSLPAKIVHEESESRGNFRAFALRAVSLDDADPYSHLAMVSAYLWDRDHHDALREANRALALGPNYPGAHDGRSRLR